MIAGTEPVPILAQDGGGTGTARIAEIHHVLPVVLRGDPRAFTDGLEHSQIGLMSDKNKAMAVVDREGRLEQSDGLCGPADGKSLHGAAVLLEMACPGNGDLLAGRGLGIALAGRKSHLRRDGRGKHGCGAAVAEKDRHAAVGIIDGPGQVFRIDQQDEGEGLRASSC